MKQKNIYQPDKEERVAKITAWQVIITALITTLGGISGALIQKYSSRPPESPQPSVSQIVQPWIRIKGVEFVDSLPNSKVRVIIYVNGIAYSYPSRTIWAEVSSQMPQEDFPLPVEAKEYKISFALYQMLEGGSVQETEGREVVAASQSPPKQDNVGQATSQQVVTVKQFPFDYEYSVFGISSGTRSGRSLAKIKFEIRSDL